MIFKVYIDVIYHKIYDIKKSIIAIKDSFFISCLMFSIGRRCIVTNKTKGTKNI